MSKLFADYFFLNFLLNPDRSIMPLPSKSMVVGKRTHLSLSL
jgi:hypothetical protein